MTDAHRRMELWKAHEKAHPTPLSWESFKRIFAAHADFTPDQIVEAANRRADATTPRRCAHD